jgi:hypothetical protein
MQTQQNLSRGSGRGREREAHEGEGDRVGTLYLGATCNVPTRSPSPSVLRTFASIRFAAQPREAGEVS